MGSDIGDYGDYTQSHRGPIYQCFAEALVAEKGLPCFMTEADIAEIPRAAGRLRPESQHLRQVGKAAISPWKKSKPKLAAGTPYVIRLKSDGDMSLPEGIRSSASRVEDAIRGTLDMPVNDQDTVLLKATAIPTCHFAMWWTTI